MRCEVYHFLSQYKILGSSGRLGVTRHVRLGSLLPRARFSEVTTKHVLINKILVYYAYIGKMGFLITFIYKALVFNF